MKTPLLSLAGPATGLSTSGIRYAPFAAGGQTASWGTAAGSRTPIARAGTITRLHVRTPVALTQGSYAFVLQVNGVDTALTCTVSTGQTTATDTTHSVAVAAGDDVCWKCTPTGTPDAQTVVQIAAVFESTDEGAGVLFSGHISTATAHWDPLSGCGPIATESYASSVFPTAGEITRLYVRLGVAPGAGTSRTYTLRKNGVDTGLTVTIADSATTGSITGGSVSFAPGDVATVGVTITGTPAASVGFAGLDWLPTTDGEALLFCNWATALSTTADRYGNANGFTAGAEATETNTYNIVPDAFTIRRLRAKISTAPGAAKSRGFILRKGGVSQPLAATISGASDITAEDAGNFVSVTSGDLINILASPSGTPAAITSNSVGMVAYTGDVVARTPTMMLLGAG